jgi:hypothetical protein
MQQRKVLGKITGLLFLWAWVVLVLTTPVLAQEKAQDPLPSWNESSVKQAILSFVREVTDKSGPKYVPPEDRIATFDQDGTTWVEHPLYSQARFALDRVHKLAPRHPEWKTKQPFKAILRNDREAMARFTDKDWSQIISVTHSGMTVAAFLKTSQEWLAQAKHPRFNRLYTELVYLPMLEVMQFLRKNGFKTYIVTGSGLEFVRAYGDKAYGVPPEQVVGSSLVTKYTYRNCKPELLLLPKEFFYNNFDGKAIGINLFIGKRPLAAFGNSTGDRQMLEWTQAGGGPRLMMLVLHDDPKREYAYGPAEGLPNTKVGTFSQALFDEAKQRNWGIISMKKDWKKIFAWE